MAREMRWVFAISLRLCPQLRSWRTATRSMSSGRRPICLPSNRANPCPHPVDDEVPFEFSDGPDDDDDGPSQRAAGIKIFPEADELDVEVVEFVQHFEELPHGPRDPVRGPYRHHLEAAAASILEQVIEAQPGELWFRRSDRCTQQRSENPLQGHRTEIIELSLGIWSTLDTRRHKATVFISAPRSRPRHHARSSTPDPAEADS